jgi:hypothetical protein
MKLELVLPIANNMAKWSNEKSNSFEILSNYMFYLFSYYKKKSWLGVLTGKCAF